VSGFTVIVTGGELETGVVDAHVAFEVNSTVTDCPFVRLVVENEFPVPELVPLIFHIYDGLFPPFTGDALNVMFSPGQIVVFDAEIDTDGVNTGFTVIVRMLLVVLHKASSEEVTTTLILSELIKVLDVKSLVLLGAP